MEIFHGKQKHVIMDKEDRRTDDYNHGFIAGQSHSKPSPETLKMFEKMSEEITQLKVTTTRIEGKVDNIIETLKNHIFEEAEYRKTQDEFHKMIMEKKANVWTEKVLIGGGSFIGLAVLGSLMGLVLIK